MISDWHKYFEYDEECESCLKWKFEIRYGGLVLAVPGQVAGTSGNGPYYRVQLNKKLYAVHRIIWEMFNGSIAAGLQIDHKDLDKNNNRLGNLRLVTRQVNCRNRPLRSDSATGVNGLSMRLHVGRTGATTKSWLARYSHLDSRRVAKQFSESKFGEAAQSMAITWLNAIKEANEYADMYAENHGK